ncbi:PREDICTED: apelin receptor B-like [Cyprinodon variegatus]|uniref:apelin receptor B-like n=1 Tax=Cyprinodon variegatus TaxID=28743 RepID=UPI000742B207|nr:PREDICTED: apelin receptor B-like [Cyprinodon variegatus]
MSAFPYPVTPTPPMFHCDYSDWSPSFYIIPSVYLLSFLVGCLGNSLVLWVYLHRTNARGIRIRDKRRIAIGKLCCSFRATHHDASRTHHVSDRGNPSGQSYRPSSHAFSSSSLPPSIPRPSRSLTDSLIASLALADLCFLVTLPFWAAYTAMGYHWPFGQPLCQISSFLTALNMYASIFSLSMLSVERYWVLTGRRHSGHYPLQRCPNRTLWILIAVWTLAGILALPGLLRSVREVELDPKSRDDPGSFVLSCQMDYSMLVGAELDEAEKDSAEMWWAAVLSLKSTLIGFLLPLVILLICYCSLARLLSRHFGHGPRPDRRHQRRLLRVIITLVMAFFLCWLPLHINKTISVLMEFDLVPYSCSLDQALLAAHPYVTCLAYLNSCLNPLLYAACDPSFRGRCRATLLMWCRVCREEDEGNGKTEVKERLDRSSNVPTRTLEETEGRTEDEEEEEDRL